jgi:hypothetical protein
MTELTEVHALDYFAGGVPASVYFRLQLDSIRDLVAPCSDDEDGTLIHVCFIGVMSYFEAFIKDQFASLINLCPPLLTALEEKNQNVQVSAASLVALGENAIRSLGFLVAEQHDFGTAQKINALYGALIRISPFSSDERVKHEGILRDRNLHVHHGGTYTTKHLISAKMWPAESEAAFFHSVVVHKTELLAVIDFLQGIADKSAKAAKSAVERYVRENGIALTEAQERGISLFLDPHEIPPSK